MRKAGTSRHRRAQIVSIISVLTVAGEPLLGASSVGSDGNSMITGAPVLAKSTPNLTRDDGTVVSGRSLTENRTLSVMEPASMLFLVGALMSLAGFTGINRRDTGRFED